METRDFLGETRNCHLFQAIFGQLAAKLRELSHELAWTDVGIADAAFASTSAGASPPGLIFSGDLDGIHRIHAIRRSYPGHRT